MSLGVLRMYGDDIFLRVGEAFMVRFLASWADPISGSAGKRELDPLHRSHELTKLLNVCALLAGTRAHQLRQQLCLSMERIPEDR